MAGVGNNLQGVSPSQSRQRLLVEFDDPDICAADNEEGRRLNSVEKIAGEVRTPPARNDRADAMREVRGRNERSRRSRAGAEQSERKPREMGLLVQPVDGVDKSVRQQRDVKHIATIGLFGRREEVKQQSRNAPAVQRVGDRVVSRAQPTGAAAVSEDNKRASVPRNI